MLIIMILIITHHICVPNYILLYPINKYKCDMLIKKIKVREKM
jgi:hypothetical protein